jgi:hypothetical protein
MNVLILTPDAVGSTLLQRLITIYMQFHKYDRPVINIHELSNGIGKYYNSRFCQDVLGKKQTEWAYHQQLKEIVELLSGADHYKTGRLAHYHIKNRKDSLSDQIPFYQYLNDNFYIISCRRHNVFEHALSWCLSKITKKLNVYSGDEKINNFFDLYRNGIDIDPGSLIQTLNAYRDYVNWCNDHFNVANYFYYDEHLPQIEKYILGLPIFGQQNRLTWKESFGINFDDWNRCHYLDGDLGTLALDHPEIFHRINDKSSIKGLNVSTDDMNFLIAYQRAAEPEWPQIKSIEEYQNLPNDIKQKMEKIAVVPDSATDLVVNQTSLKDLLPATHQDFYNNNKKFYESSMTTLVDMVSSGILMSTPPVKKQTLAEKKHIIKNYKYLLKVYNQWITLNPEMGNVLDEEILDKFADIERARWNPAVTEIALTAQQKNN